MVIEKNRTVRLYVVTLNGITQANFLDVDKAARYATSR